MTTKKTKYLLVNYKIQLFQLIIITLFLLSCQNKNCEKDKKEIQSIMKGWFMKTIVFSNKMEVLSYKKIENTIKLQKNKKQKTILHFFTADCDKCVNELKLIQKSLELEEFKNDVQYVFIANAPTKTYVTDAISKLKFPYPIYYEKDYLLFKKINNLPLYDDLYNTMLLNSDNKVILFGAFYANEKALKLYHKAINCENL